jgi:LuxR family transcriptional regulator, maltose regulon positive regulatory protein
MKSDRQNSVTESGNIDFIIRSKLYRPPISRDHVHRSALLDRLDTHQQQPLTLVSAPAGYGKSTLVSCWLGGVRH